MVKNGRGVGFGPYSDNSSLFAPAAINSSDMVVGTVYYLEGHAVYTIKNGKYEALARDDYHGVSALNNRGQYVGWRCAGSVIQDGPFRATLWQHGHKYNLNHLIPKDSGWDLEYANGINNHGEIVGTGGYGERLVAFKLIPSSPTPVSSARH
jgi:hypothetical protein